MDDDLAILKKKKINDYLLTPHIKLTVVIPNVLDTLWEKFYKDSSDDTIILTLRFFSMC